MRVLALGAWVDQARRSCGRPIFATLQSLLLRQRGCGRVTLTSGVARRRTKGVRGETSSYDLFGSPGAGMWP